MRPKDCERPSRGRRIKETLLLFWVGLLTTLPWLVCAMVFWVLVLVGREEKRHFWQRLGRLPAKRPPGPVIWLHGASVGESLAFQGLLQMLLREKPNTHFLLTTTSRASGLFWERKIQKNPALKGRLSYSVLPFDHPFLMKRFVRFWVPDALLLNEADLWPVMQCYLARAGVKRFLLSGRLSEATYRRWRWALWLFRRMTRDMTIVATTSVQAKRFQDLGGAAPLCVAPSLKWFTVMSPEADHKKSYDPEKPLWLCAGSTHPGEEEVVLKAAQQLRSLSGKMPYDVRVIVAPRDVGRAKEVLAQAKRFGLNPVLWSALSEKPENVTFPPDATVVVIDQMGILNQAYRLAHVAFVGGSLFKGIGGHNVIESAHAGCAILHGPFMETQNAILEVFKASALTTRVSVDSFSEILEDLLRQPSEIHALGTGAQKLALNKRQQAIQAYKQIAATL